MKRWGIIGALAAAAFISAIAPPLFAGGSTIPLICYTQAYSDYTRFRTWDGSNWSGEASSKNIDNEATWIRLRWCPTRDEYACGLLDWGNDLNLTFFKAGVWIGPTELSTNTTNYTTRPFDIAYEQTSGDMLIAHWDDGYPLRVHYRTYNGVALSSDQTLALPADFNVRWIKLVPEPGTDRILMLALNDPVDLYAVWWNGSSWGSVVTLNDNCETSSCESFDAAFESLSGDLLVAYTSSGSNEPRYRTWNGSSWSSEGSMPSVGRPQRWLRLAADPASDQILFGCTDSGRDLNVNVWNGSSWGSNSELTTDATWNQLRSFDIAYECGGTEALIIYPEDWEHQTRYRTWNGSSWSAEMAGFNLGDEVTTPQLVTGLSNGEIYIATQDDGDDLHFLIWDGNSFAYSVQLESQVTNWGSPSYMLALPNPTTSLVFTDVSSGSGLDVRSSTDLESGSGWHWGDFDNDGDLDAICTGNSYARLLLSNNASGTFTASSFGGGVVIRQGALLDIDDDGDLDFWGLPTYSTERVWVNDGSGAFSSAGDLGFSSPNNSEGIATADVDHDGRCDVVVFSANGNWIGFNTSGSPATLSGSNSSSYGMNDAGDYGNGDYCSAGDANNDGYTDFFFLYNSGKLFLSDGDGTYTQTNLGISVETGEYDKTGSAWGDYDNDGDLDLWVSRYDSGYAGYLWQNRLVETGSVSFTNVATSAGITDTSRQRGCCWGDYDNDGDLDLYIVTAGGVANILYQNQGAPNWNFVPVVVGAEAPGDGHDAVFVDYDNDGDLDLAITQEDTANTLLRNNTDSGDYLKVRVLGGGACGTNRSANGVRVELWNEDATVFLGMREIGTARGYAGAEPMWVHFGGVNPALTYTVKARMVGGWTSEQVIPAATTTTIDAVIIPQMLTVEEEQTQVVYTDVSSDRGFNVRTSTDESYASGLHWDDLDGDGDMDAIIGGNSYARLVINNGPDATFTLSNLGGGCVYRQGAVLDVDNDGDLDYRGLPHYNDETLWVNDGAASFSSASSAGFSDPYNNEGMAAADIDGDGMTDIVQFAENGNWIGHNQSTDPPTFAGTKASSYGLNDSGDVGNGDYCSSGDVNNDGQLDFFYHYNSGKLFLSDGDGTYTQNNHGISVTTGNSDKMGSAWGDYDNDGDLDLFVSRFDSGQIGYLWRNDVDWSTGSGNFTNVTVSAGILNAAGQYGCCWGDYDNDGDLDLYIVTRSGAANVLYRNQGDGTFVEACAGATAPGNGQDAAFVDYDNDGDLDLSITQEDTGNTLLKNNTDDTNYLKVRIVGKGAGGTNKVGTGIRVELWNADGTTFLARRDLGVARGFGGNESHWAHFGGVTNSGSYTVKVYFTGKPVTEPYTVSVIPTNATTTFGATLVPQLLTIEESDEIKVIRWREVPNRPSATPIAPQQPQTGGGGPPPASPFGP